MKVEFVPNLGADGMLNVCGISQERYAQMIPKMKELANKLFDDDSYQYDEYFSDMIAIAENESEFAYLAYQSGRKVEEHERVTNNPFIALLNQ